MGVPPLHIIRANNGSEFRFYELTGDLPDALHFNHFNKPDEEFLLPNLRIRLGDETEQPDLGEPVFKSRITLRDEA